jgi:prophage regulatory protein
MTHQLTDNNHFYSDRNLASRYKVSRATILRWASSGNLPNPCKLSENCTRWRSSDIEAWEKGVE